MKKFAEGLKNAEDCMLMEPDEKQCDISNAKDNGHDQELLEPSSHHDQKKDNAFPKKSEFSLPDNNQPSMSHLLDRPQCIICGDNTLNETSIPSDKQNSKVLAFCALVQPSVVLKGGGSTPCIDDGVSTNLGIHMSLCGHAVHTSCCESHLNGTNLRENVLVDRNKKEFRCPLCRRLSNCLVPCIDIGSEWVKKVDEKRKGNFKERKVESKDEKPPLLHDFLSQSKWWATRNDKSVVWNGRCSFVPSNAPLDNSETNILPKITKIKTNGKKDLYKAWGSVLSTPSFIKRVDSTLSDDSDSQPDNSVISPNTDVWRKVLDRIVDVSYKADLKRLGEEYLFLNFGEFRHYLLEKNVFNQSNSLAGIEPSNWPSCMQMIPSDNRQELSKEKLISKLFLTIQTLTYSCCSEELECKRQSKLSSSSQRELAAKFGIGKIVCNGNLIVLPNHLAHVGGYRELFRGKIGRLRHFALAVMIATSPLSHEVVQLSLAFPEISNNQTQPNREYSRAPVVFPILCGHVLTHVVAALCASSGEEGRNSYISALPNREITKDENNSVHHFDNFEDCKSFIQLGYVAKVLQVSLGFLQQQFQYSPLEWRAFETQIFASISSLLKRETKNLTVWERACSQMICVAFQNHTIIDENKTSCRHEMDENIILNAFKTAKLAGYEYLCSVCLIFQVLAPSSVLSFNQLDEKCNEDRLYDLMNIDIGEMLRSSLVCQVIGNWYCSARPRFENSALKKRLHCKSKFRAFDWPCVSYTNNSLGLQKKTSLRIVPLFQGYTTMGNAKDDKPRIQALPTSYTDLYAELNRFSSSGESTALCLVCGEVLNADGKGDCNKHALVCGGGCGIFFLLQKCNVLILRNTSAAIIPSPYVDSHGETPHYRGRPLFLDMSRYDGLQELWSSHLIREKVSYERSKCQAYQLLDIDNINY